MKPLFTSKQRQFMLAIKHGFYTAINLLLIVACIVVSTYDGCLLVCN